MSLTVIRAGRAVPRWRPPVSDGRDKLRGKASPERPGSPVRAGIPLGPSGWRRFRIDAQIADSSACVTPSRAHIPDGHSERGGPIARQFEGSRWNLRDAARGLEGRDRFGMRASGPNNVRQASGQLPRGGMMTGSESWAKPSGEQCPPLLG